MKNTLGVVLLTIALHASFIINAQMPDKYGVGTMTNTYCVSIDTSKPLEDYYRIDISSVGFESETEARKVCGYISNNRLTYILDYANQAIYLKIHKDRTKEPQDVIWWNNYIQSLCKN